MSFRSWIAGLRQYHFIFILLGICVLLGIGLIICMTSHCPPCFDPSECPNVCNLTSADLAKIRETLPATCLITEADWNKLATQLEYPDCICEEECNLTEEQLQTINATIQERSCLPSPDQLSIFISIAIGFISLLIVWAGKEKEGASKTVAFFGILILLSILIWLGLPEYALMAFIVFAFLTLALFLFKD